MIIMRDKREVFCRSSFFIGFYFLIRHSGFVLMVCPLESKPGLCCIASAASFTSVSIASSAEHIVFKCNINLSAILPNTHVLTT